MLYIYIYFSVDVGVYFAIYIYNVKYCPVTL